MATGYNAGQPFGDPNQFTRGTGEDELDRFNAWMRSQPFWQKIRGMSTGDLSGVQQQEIEAALAAQGIKLPSGFKVDEAGNLNQKNRLGRNLAIGAAAGAAAFGAPALIGALGAGGGAAGGAAGGIAAGGAGTLSAGTLPGLVAGLGSAGTAAGVGGGLAAGAGSGIMSKMGGMLTNPGLLEAGGRMLSAGSQAAAHNRGTMLDAMMEQDRTRLVAAGDQREGERDAWKKLQHADYVKNWQAPKDTGLPSFGFGPQAPGAGEQQAAALLEQEMLKRLREGGFKPTPITDYSKAGKSETLSGLLGAGLTGYSALR